MKYTTHNIAQISINGTSLQGYCDENTTYAELVALFGEPQKGDGYKVDAEWTVMFDDGTIASIYNYKNGKNYEGASGMDVIDMTGEDWHIGGNTKKSVEMIRETIEAHREWIKTNGGDAPTPAADPVVDLSGFSKDENADRPVLTEEDKQGLRDKLEGMMSNNHGICLLSIANVDGQDEVNHHIMNASSIDLSLAFFSVIEDHPEIMAFIAENLISRKGKDKSA